MILLGDCIQRLKEMEENSVDACITDPPYALTPTKGAKGGFMGKQWDAEVPSVEIWREVFRVLKPGAQLLSFGGTRTYHHMAMNVELAGFEVRDMLAWLYGSGFPKSLNISKAIDKAGAERTADAKRWQGYGTALKPAHEPIVLARKPLSENTVAKNVLKWGVGGLNIDQSRIGVADSDPNIRINETKGRGYQTEYVGGKVETLDNSHHGPPTQGRWPANLLFDEEAAELLDLQSGQSRSVVRQPTGGVLGHHHGQERKLKDQTVLGLSDQGGASRFFYVAKASKRERNAGLEGMPVKESKHAYGDGLNSATKLDPKQHTEESVAARIGNQNNHPTVKPQKLMEYLIKLITPTGGLILDPFAGSGSTGVAAFRLGYKFIGIEMSEEYVEIAKKRLEHAMKDPA